MRFSNQTYYFLEKQRIIIALIITILIFIPIWNKKLTEIQNETQENIAAMNRSQIAAFYEKNTFITSTEELYIAEKLKNQNYDYSIKLGYKTVFNYAIPHYGYLKSYVSGVFIKTPPDKNFEFKTILCEAKFSGKNQPKPPTDKNGVVACGNNMRKIGT
ncbi:MAG: type IV pilin-like G/H family protein [Cyanomargarita calcarea GSE-NOS-MK-12-04C]|jgi:competence protein ComGC|uniref:Type IV pilin-like G/H family protein n=1 Tax=Cyanomargarita calcarea GSE-NOS-MK-12-04C TaxID=2839659 RepID=A0A951QSI2_9CYAN|nr:type IV pilin-like G/H family protein [Cyanomargarita calcarea GSE-NOS-MK-12-04C]